MLGDLPAALRERGPKFCEMPLSHGPPTIGGMRVNAFIDVLGAPGAVSLDRRAVRFIVPPTAP